VLAKDRVLGWDPLCRQVRVIADELVLLVGRISFAFGAVIVVDFDNSNT
jgi:hypothetical protein